MKIIIVLLLAATISACQENGNNAMSLSIQDVKSKHESELMAKPGVVSVGIGMGDDSQPVIIIGVENSSALNAEDLPSEIEGYPVKTQVIGSMRAQ